MNGNENTASHNSKIHCDPIYFSSRELFRVAKKASSAKDEKFNNLMHHLTPILVSRNICKMNKNTAVGVDGLNRDNVLENLEQILPKKLDQIHKCQYKAPDSRRVYIPKSNGKKRPLAIGNILDRGIQGAVAEILNNIYEQDFQNCSWGFRPNKSCHHALKDLESKIFKGGQTYLLEVDLENFFGTLNHGWLMRFLEHRISDKRMLALIESWLKAGILEEGIVTHQTEGTPQGGAISPLLANIYLHYVLDLWVEKVMHRKFAGRISLVRYADDFIVSFHNSKDLESFFVALKIRLEQFGLKLSTEKTKKTKLGQKVNLKDYGTTATFLGFTIFMAPRNNKRGFKMVYKTNRKKLSGARGEVKIGLKKRMHLPMEIQARYLNSVLRGHFNYYGLPGNTRSLKTFYDLARKYWKYVLMRRTRDKFISWEEFDEIQKKYKIIPPRLKYTYVKFMNFSLAT